MQGEECESNIFNVNLEGTYAKNKAVVSFS